MTTKFAKDLLERVLWTAAEAGLAVAVAAATDIKAAWAVPIAAGLSYVKGLVAKHIGNKDSASTAPSV